MRVGNATVYGTGTVGRCWRQPGRAVTAFEAGRADPLEPAGEPARDHQVHRRVAGSAPGGTEGGPWRFAGSRRDWGADPAGGVLPECALAAQLLVRDRGPRPGGTGCRHGS